MVGPPFTCPHFYWPIHFFQNGSIKQLRHGFTSQTIQNEGRGKMWVMNSMKTSSKMKWRSMRIDSRERRRGLTPFILLPRSLLLTAPPLLAPRWGAKLFRLRRKSSIRPSAPSSLVVLGGGREERRAGRRRMGQAGALFQFCYTSFQHCGETSSKSPSNGL